MHSQLRSQQIAIEGVKDKLNREKKDELERREQDFQQDMSKYWVLEKLRRRSIHLFSVHTPNCFLVKPC